MGQTLHRSATTTHVLWAAAMLHLEKLGVKLTKLTP